MFLSSQCCFSLGKWRRAVLTSVSWVSGCLLGVEAISLHFTYFSKLWMEVYQKAGEVSRFSCPNKSLFCRALPICQNWPAGQVILRTKFSSLKAWLYANWFFEFLQNGTYYICNFEEFVHHDLKTCALHLRNDCSGQPGLIIN